MLALQRHGGHTSRVVRSGCAIARRCAYHLQRRAAMAARPAVEVPDGMSEEAALLEAFTSIPQLAKATCRPYGSDGVQLQVVATQHNLPANSKRALQFTAFLASKDQIGSAVCSPLPTELQPTTMTSVSPSGQRVLISKAGADGVLLEVWGGGRLLKELQVPKSLHGPAIADNVFSRGASWTAEEDKVVYVAEAPVPQKTPQWGSPADGPKDAAAPRGWRGVAEATEDWGELNAGKQPPSLFVLDLKTWQVQQVLGLPEGQSCGQPVWDPSGAGIVFVAWPHTPVNFPSVVRRLGVVFCFNRPSVLNYVPHTPLVPGVTIQQPAVGDKDNSKAAGPAADSSQPAVVPVAFKLSGELLSALQPLFTPDGSRLVFLSQQAAATTGVHAATSSLHLIDVEGWAGSGSGATAIETAARQLAAGNGGKAAAGEAAPLREAITKWNTWAEQQQQLPVKTVVDVVRRPAEPGGFPGLYATATVDNPWAGPRQLLLTSQWYSQTAVVSIDLDTGAVQPVTPTGAAAGSWTLQGVVNGVAACISSTPGGTARVMLAPVPPNSSGSGAVTWPWQPLSCLDLSGQLPPSAAAGLAGVEWAVLDVNPTCGDTSLPMQAIVQAPKARDGPLPVVLVPHGGPHTAIPLNYYLPFSFLTTLGYCVVGVNYRGSTGFGEDSVQSLPGSVGTNDVADCMAALAAAVKAGYADPQRAAVVGGSHGGFLTGHLVGQHPAAFRCAALRNPVLNIALMVGLTDIPEWCYVEAFGTEEGRARFKPTPSAEDLARFMEVSPIAHVDKVSVPLAFMLGSKDRRVPDDDGRRYIDALKARGVPTRVLVFPEDTHALDKPQTEYEQWLNITWWLKKYVRS